MPLDIDALQDSNTAKANAMRALRLLNKALLPWQLQPKRRKAVLTAASPKCRDDGHCIEEVEPNQPDGMAWEEASDASEAETDHALDDEFACQSEQKKMERLIAKASMQMATYAMDKVTKKTVAAKKFAPHKHGDRRPASKIAHWGLSLSTRSTGALKLSAAAWAQVAHTSHTPPSARSETTA